MNLKQLKTSNRKPTAGEIFVFQLRQRPGEFFFGKVIRTDASVGPFKNTILIYLYDARSSSKVEVPELQANRLLLPPIHTNQLPWKKGYFETVKAEPILSKELLPAHHFKDSFGRVFDDNSQPVDIASTVVGEFGVHSYKTIDDAISHTLGLPVSA